MWGGAGKSNKYISMFKYKHVMLNKTITIQEEAYTALKALQLENESFSETILRMSKMISNLKASWGSGIKTDEEYEQELREIEKQRAHFFCRERLDEVSKYVFPN